MTRAKTHWAYQIDDGPTHLACGRDHLAHTEFFVVATAGEVSCEECKATPRFAEALRAYQARVVAWDVRRAFDRGDR